MAEEKSRVDLVTLWGIIMGTALWVFGVLGVLLYWSRLPEVLPLFYSRPSGEDQLVSKGVFLGALIVVGLVMGANFVLAYYLGRSELLLKRFLVWGGVMVVLLFLMSLARILLIIL